MPTTERHFLGGLGQGAAATFVQLVLAALSARAGAIIPAERAQRND